MNGNAAIDYRNPSTIRKLGIDVLTKEMGALGMAYFIRQFDRGEGNYTAERRELLGEMTLEDIEKQLNQSPLPSENV